MKLNSMNLFYFHNLHCKLYLNVRYRFTLYSIKLKQVSKYVMVENNPFPLYQYLELKMFLPFKKEKKRKN